MRSAPRSATDGYVQGAIAILPILLGVIPFGMIAGVAGVRNGATAIETTAFSIISFAGAAQIAAMDLLGQGSSVWVALGTTLIINLRFVMFSASLAPHVASDSFGKRFFGSYILTDHAYAVAMNRYALEPAPRKSDYYLGAALAFWVTWQLSTVIGTLIGTGLPDNVPLDFAVPLSFLALLMPSLTGRPEIAAALVGAVVATLGSQLPGNLGMLLGALVGIAGGYAVLRTQRRGRAS